MGISTAGYVALASAAASAAGNYLQTQANNQSTAAQQEARNAANEQGYEQQQAFQKSADSAFNNTLNQTNPAATSTPATSLPTLAANNTAAINANSTPATGTAIASNNISGAPKVVQNSFANKMADASTYGNQQATALGEVMAPGQQFQNIGQAIMGGQSQEGNIADEANTQATATRAEANSAYNNARKAPSIFGQVLSEAGTAGGIAAAGAGGLSNLESAGGQAVQGGVRGLSSLPPGPIAPSQYFSPSTYFGGN